MARTKFEEFCEASRMTMREDHQRQLNSLPKSPIGDYDPQGTVNAIPQPWMRPTTSLRLPEVPSQLRTAVSRTVSSLTRQLTGHRVELHDTVSIPVSLTTTELAESLGKSHSATPVRQCKVLLRLKPLPPLEMPPSPPASPPGTPEGGGSAPTGEAMELEPGEILESLPSERWEEAIPDDAYNAEGIREEERANRALSLKYVAVQGHTFEVRMFGTQTVINYSQGDYTFVRMALATNVRLLAIDDARIKGYPPPSKWAAMKIVVDTVSIVAKPNEFDMPEPCATNLAALYTRHWSEARATDQRLGLSPLIMTSALLGVLDDELNGQTAFVPGSWRPSQGGELAAERIA